MTEMDPRRIEVRETWGEGEESTPDEVSAKLSREHFLGLLDYHGIALKTARIIELGSGKGHLLASIQELGIDITGIDARPRPFDVELPIHDADIHHLGNILEPGYYDAIISRDVLDPRYYNQDIAKIGQEISKVLGDRGIYIGKEPNAPELIVPETRKSTIAGQFQIFRRGPGFVAESYDFARRFHI